MKKIEKLTKKQEAQLEVYKNKWISIGLSTEHPSFERTKEIIDNVYVHLLQKTVVPVVVLDNPYDTWISVCIYAFEENQVRNQVENQVWDQVWNQVENQVRNQVWNQVGNQVRDQKDLMDFIYPYIEGNFISGYFAFYDFCLNELNLDLDINLKNNFNVYKDTSELSLVYPFNDICFACSKPIEINFNENKVLHNAQGASIKYKNGFELYHLNGVKITKEIAKIKPEKITVNMILQEQNVEVRRELLRKLGINNFIKKLKTKPIEISEDKIYELYKIKLGEDLNGTYLKMLNPSLKDTYHFEGVANTCNTIEEALAWRDSEDVYIKPIELT